MIALDDAALARVIRGAQAVPYGQRRRWLQSVADQLDSPDARAAARRARHAAEMRTYRKRQAQGIALFYVAADPTTFDRMQKYAGLTPNKIDDKRAVQAALGRLLRAGLAALDELEALRLRYRK
jgi:hypothetical protein